MSGYPGNYNQPPSAYPPVTQHAPTQGYQSHGPTQTPYPPPQQYPQSQYGAPQQYPPASGYPPQQYAQQGGYAPQGSYPQPAYPTSPYPPTAGWGAPQPYPTYPQGGMAYPAPGVYAAPAMAMAVAPVMAIPMMPAMNYKFQLRGVHLDRKDILSKSDPFLVLWASKHPGGYHHAGAVAKREKKSTKHNKKFGGISGNWVMVHRTETIHNNQNPCWAPFLVNLITLCGGNFDSVFKVEVWDSDVHSNHDFIGGAVTNMRELQMSKEVRLVNKRRIGIHNSSGRLEVIACAPC